MKKTLKILLFPENCIKDLPVSGKTDRSKLNINYFLCLVLSTSLWLCPGFWVGGAGFPATNVVSYFPLEYCPEIRTISPGFTFSAIRFTSFYLIKLRDIFRTNVYNYIRLSRCLLNFYLGIAQC